MTKRYSLCNDYGLYWKTDEPKVRVRSLRVFEESGTVTVTVGSDTHQGVLGIDELLVYLTPEEAMAFSKAFERCAIAALKANA